MLAEPVARLGLMHGPLQTLGLRYVFTANVDVALVGADGVAGDRHALEQLVRVGVHENAILEHQRLRLVRIADDVFLRRRFLLHRPPFEPGGKARAPSAGQCCGFELIDDRAGRCRQRFLQTTIGAELERRIDRVRIALVGVSEQDTLLTRERLGVAVHLRR